MNLAAIDPATDKRFDRRLPQTIQWRGSDYTNNRSNVTFIRLWNRFFNRHDARPLFDMGDLYGYRPANKEDRIQVRISLHLLRTSHYVR